MKNLRKLICVLLASAMMLSMAACGGEQTSTEANTTTPTETEAETEDTTSAETTETADDSDRPEGVSAEDWEAMKQEIILPKWIQEIGKIKKCAFAV